MQSLVEDSKIAETDISHPETGCWPYGRDGVCADQEPKQVMMDELGQGAKREITAIHRYRENTFMLL